MAVYIDEIISADYYPKSNKVYLLISTNKDFNLRVSLDAKTRKITHCYLEDTEGDSIRAPYSRIPRWISVPVYNFMNNEFHEKSRSGTKIFPDFWDYIIKYGEYYI